MWRERQGQTKLIGFYNLIFHIIPSLLENIFNLSMANILKQVLCSAGTLIAAKFA